jgi:phosphoribosyl 1,2-cyclic phosphate phosphodiesterase
MGFDDLRPFSTGGRTIDVFGSTPTLDALARIFDFAFAAETRFPGYLHPIRRDVGGRFEIGGVTVDPVWLPHGRMVTTGYVFSRGGRRLFAYMTDCSSVPEEAMRVAEGAEHIVVDGLRERLHPTHMTYEAAAASALQMRAGRGWLTHLCHDFRHVEVEGRLPKGVGVAYDGLVLEM